ncbi:DsbA family protein [Martelella mediterranea]|uniref:Protein-disulfide isomerase n=1 Tax=Martelella mediterranea TaxID=293089 RepID=A0A4R3NL20_9HYPH|nr:DsbA family protein [Martelella mediterranea]TCT34729.1 protein-disulfide isomerase [Martelella mediterranea]
MKRRRFLVAAVFAATFSAFAGIAPAQAQSIDVQAILHDPDAPEAGNPDGDVTIVAFLDYNCPYCKKTAPDLERIVEEDGNIRLVYKDWPVLSEASVYGAQLAIGAKYQDKYEDVHHALMSVPGHKVSEDEMLFAVRETSVDMQQLQDDLTNHHKEIVALLGRTMEQGDALGLVSTPTYLIGPMMTTTLDYDGFKEAVAEARRRHAAGERVE